MDGIFVFVVIAIVVIALAVYFDYKRREMWRRLAQRYGLTYHRGDPLELVDSSLFALFQEGHGRKISNTLVGSVDGMEIILFDYTYTTGSGKHQQTHHYSGLLLLYSDAMGAFDEDEVQSCLNDARGFLDRLPSYLLKK